MPQSTMSNVSRAFAYAYSAHDGQTRKGKETPYIAHLMSVAAMVYEMGGTDTEVIAALLHDSVEDQGGVEMLTEIRQEFGEAVAQIVTECSDSFGEPKPPWQERKEQFLDKIKSFGPSTLKVVLADKIHNTRSTLLELKSRDHNDVWHKFNGGKNGTIWYYNRIKEELEGKLDSVYYDEFCSLVDEITNIANQER